MRNQRRRLLQGLLMGLLLCVQPLAAQADDASAGYKTESFAIDPGQQSGPSEQSEQSGADLHPMLFGTVQRNGAKLPDLGADTTQNPTQESKSAGGAGNLRAEAGTTDNNKPPVYALALKKLAAKQGLTTEEYRSLGIGILGYESDRTYFQNQAIVSIVYKGCPAADAGIKVGDKIEVTGDEADDSKIVDPSRPTWMFSCGIEGQPVDVSVKRHRKTVDIHLVRMNMEDVPDTRLRHQYEQLVQRLGASQGHVDGSVEFPKPVTAGSVLKTLFKLVI